MEKVDKLDWLVNKYRVKIRGKKWYFRLFTNMIHVTVVNAHVLFCLVNELIPPSDFRKLIVRIYLRKSSISDSKKDLIYTAYHSLKDVAYSISSRKNLF